MSAEGHHGHHGHAPAPYSAAGRLQARSGTTAPQRAGSVGPVSARRHAAVVAVVLGVVVALLVAAGSGCWNYGGQAP